jgi:tRNA-2-methylthio-N6-dimethylallyladenosine synthase
VGFSGLFSFTYSPRPGTSAFRLTDDVPESVKRERLAEVNRVQQAIQLVANSARVGTREEVLVEAVGRDGRLEGRARDCRIVHCEGPARFVGSLVDVQITSAGPNSLVGRLLSPDDRGTAIDSTAKPHDIV